MALAWFFFEETVRQHDRCERQTPRNAAQNAHITLPQSIQCIYFLDLKTKIQNSRQVVRAGARTRSAPIYQSEAYCNNWRKRDAFAVAIDESPEDWSALAAFEEIKLNPGFANMTSQFSIAWNEAAVEAGIGQAGNCPLYLSSSDGRDLLPCAFHATEMVRYASRDIICKDRRSSRTAPSRTL